MIKPNILSDEKLNEAFDGDFGEVHFDHKPTAEDIFLIKLKLVAQAQNDYTIRQFREWLELPENRLQPDSDLSLVDRSALQELEG